MGAMVGRSAELAAIGRACTDARSGHGRLVLVSGPAGIGKSRLVDAAAVAAEQLGMAVARGYAVDDPGAPALWPWLRALQGRAGVDALPAADVDEGDAAARFRLFVAVTDLLRDLAARDGLVLVLEDVHWADSASVRLLRHVAAELATARLAIVVTCRDEADGPVRALLPDLLRGDVAQHITLAGLGPAELAAWLPQLAARADPAALHRVTGGNPLLVRLVAAELAAEPAALDALMAERPQLRRLVAARVSALPAAVRGVLEAAAVLGERIDPAVVSAMVDRDEVDGELAAARAGGVLRDAAFAHALVRDAVYADLQPARRAELHRRAAVALEAAAAPVPGVIARHWREAGDSARCLPWALRADDAARAALAFDDASRWASLAVDCAREAGADPTSPLLRLAEAQALDGMFERSAQTCVAAAAAAREAGCPDLQAAAALVVQGSGAPAVQRLILPLVEDALAALPEDERALRARLLAQRAVVTAETQGGALPAEQSAAALAEAERSGDPGAILEAVAARHIALSVPWTVAERLELGRRAVELGARTHRPMAAVWGHLWRLNAAMQLGTMDEVHHELDELERVARERGSVTARWHHLRGLAMLRVLTGDFDAARDADAQAFALGQRVGDVSLIGLTIAFRTQLTLVRGDVGELPAEWEAIVARSPRMPLVRISVPLVHATAGRLDDARAEFEEFREIPAAFPVGVRWAPTVTQIGLAAVLLDDAEVAWTVHELLAPTAPYYAGDGSGAVFCTGSNALLLGDLARTAGRPAVAIDHYRDAVAMNTRIGARPFTALSRLGWARALLATGHDLERARALAEPAAAEFRRLDMPGPLRTAQQVLAALEAARRTASPLSAREQEVAHLVAQALTNREIAERLVLSERTVETHVRSILAKLGFTSRTEIATWVLTS